jgi:multiple sugar transport system permease protein/raffinose/stachyose/melibiose transport system permease protein
MAVATQPTRTARRRLLRAVNRDSWGAIVVFLAPAVVLYCAFVIVPVAMTFYNSVHLLQVSGAAGVSYSWVGLQNYAALVPAISVWPPRLVWGDDVFRMAIEHSLIWGLVSPVLEIPLALLLAYVLYLRVPFAGFYRFAWYTPILVSWIVVGIIFRWVYNFEWGVVNTLLRSVGLGVLATDWLGNLGTALAALILMSVWKSIGFNLVILLAAISQVPSELTDAARMDGCNRWQILWAIILPLLRVTVVNLTVLAFMGKMQAFAAVWATTQGGPVYHTETVATYMYKRAFQWQTLDLGYPSAIAVIWFVIVFGLAILFQRILQRRDVLEF